MRTKSHAFVSFTCSSPRSFISPISLGLFHCCTSAQVLESQNCQQTQLSHHLCHLRPFRARVTSGILHDSSGENSIEQYQSLRPPQSRSLHGDGVRGSVDQEWSSLRGLGLRRVEEPTTGNVAAGIWLFPRQRRITRSYLPMETQGGDVQTHT